jgi:DNA mismatch endonuclease (patch repair protein)
MDKLSVASRTILMRRVKSKNTGPELSIRKLVFSMGFRYRLHGRKLPGKPDLYFPGRKKVIFVHGCFWHRHTDCKRASTPATRTDYWLPKFARTVKRDEESLSLLKDLGWNTLVIWECELKNIEILTDKIKKFLDKGE